MAKDRSGPGANPDFNETKGDEKGRITGVPKVILSSARKLLVELWNKKLFREEADSEKLLAILNQISEVPPDLQEPGTRLLLELAYQNLLEEKTSAEDMIAILQEQKLVFFEDASVPASFGFTEEEINNSDVINLLSFFEKRKIDSNNQMVSIRVKGNSMELAGIYENDILVVEYFTGMTEVSNGDIVLAYLVKENSSTVKKYSTQKDGKVFLAPMSYDITHQISNPGLLGEDDYKILGVVRFVIADLKDSHRLKFI